MGEVGFLWTPDSDRYQLVDMTTGETVPSTDAVHRCAWTYQAAFEPVHNAVNDFDGLIDPGRIELGFGIHEAKEIDLVPVTLGPRLDRWSDDKIILVPPGAVMLIHPHHRALRGPGAMNSRANSPTRCAPPIRSSTRSW